MVNENEYYRPVMSNYQYYPQPPHTPIYYDAMYEEQNQYYYPYMYGNNNQYGYVNQLPFIYDNPNQQQIYMYGNMNQQPYMNGINNAQPGYAPNPAPNEGRGAVTPGVMQQFLDENGNVDVQKMLSTVGQLADTVQQVSPVIRQLNDLIRNFRA